MTIRQPAVKHGPAWHSSVVTLTRHRRPRAAALCALVAPFAAGMSAGLNASTLNASTLNASTLNASTLNASTRHPAVNKSDFEQNSTEAADVLCNLTETIVENGTLGQDCPDLLPIGSVCSLACDDGYLPNASIGCLDGNWTTGGCFPLACDGAADGGGDCPEVLLSGVSCFQACPVNHTVTTPTSCLLGNLTRGTCLPKVRTFTTLEPNDTQLCPAGREWRNGKCAHCALGTWKDSVGKHPCLPCPVGSSSAGVGSDSIKHCICNATTYATRLPNNTFLGCSPCPQNSRITNLVGTSVEDCQCDKDFLRITENDTVWCRLPYPCNLSAWLANSNLTGPEPHRLHEGTCKNISLLKSGGICLLKCEGMSAPQLHSNIFNSVDTSITCKDGIIDKFPALGTICSKSSWTIPPVAFLCTVTAATLIAGVLLELRQHRFEDSFLATLDGAMAR